MLGQEYRDFTRTTQKFINHYNGLPKYCLFDKNYLFSKERSFMTNSALKPKFLANLDQIEGVNIEKFERSLIASDECDVVSFNFMDPDTCIEVGHALTVAADVCERGALVSDDDLRLLRRTI